MAWDAIPTHVLGDVSLLATPLLDGAIPVVAETVACKMVAKFLSGNYKITLNSVCKAEISDGGNPLQRNFHFTYHPNSHLLHPHHIHRH